MIINILYKIITEIQSATPPGGELEWKMPFGRKHPYTTDLQRVTAIIEILASATPYCTATKKSDWLITVLFQLVHRRHFAAHPKSWTMLSKYRHRIPFSKISDGCRWPIRKPSTTRGFAPPRQITVLPWLQPDIRRARLKARSRLAVAMQDSMSNQN